jgi:hypothetical protein
MQVQTKDLSDVGVTKVLRQAGIIDPTRTADAIKTLFMLHGNQNVTVIIGTKLIEIDVTRRCVVTDDYKIVA